MQQRASFTELLAVFTGLALLVTLQLFASGMTHLMYHPLWLDECLTQLLATDPSFTHAMAAIRGGVETNPPTLYLFLWPLAQVLGGDVVVLRAFAAAAMFLAVVGVYAICRRFFDRVPSLLAVLVLAAHPMVIEQVLQARFYGAWLAATAWFIYSLVIKPRPGNRVRLTMVRCLLAIVLATIHWFGVIVLLLIGVIDVAIAPSARGRREKLLPYLCGIGAALACLPFFFGQRAGLSVPTWMEPITFRIVARVAKHMIWAPAMLPLVIFVAWRAIGKVPPGAHWRQTARRLAPMLALLIFPGIITIFSLLVQPALLDRYVIVSVLPLGVLTAMVAPSWNDRGARWLIVAAFAGLLIAGGYEFRQRKDHTDIADARIGNAMTVVRDTIDRNGPLPIVFRDRAVQYPLIHVDPTIAEHVATLDFDGVPDPRLTALTLYERDMARRVNRFYPRYRLATVEQFRQMPSFLVIVPEYELDQMTGLLNDFEIKPVGPEVYELRPRRN